jgi:predicted nuclease of predicted toxin-antitoxin system
VRIRLDECLPKDLRKYITGHDCDTAVRVGLSGKTNGELLALAQRAGWLVLLTMDQGMPYQQNLKGRNISLVVIHSKSNRLQDLLPHVPVILSTLKSIQPGQAVRVG